MADVIVASDIHLVQSEDGLAADFDYGKQTNSGGHVDRYQCKGCGWTIIDDSAEYDKHTQDGLGGEALISRIKEMNTPTPPEKGDPVTFDDLVARIAVQYSTLSGEELAEEWNRLFDDQVVYEGDSLFWVKR